MSNATDLIQVAELIKLAARTAKTLVDSATANGTLSSIEDAIQRIEAGAEDLTRAGHILEGNVIP